jgi:taurine dioxygenase
VSEEVIRQLDAKLPPMEHPVVRTHPVSGRKCIYVNPAFTICIKDMGEKESGILLQQLFDLAKVPDYQCRFRWKRDSVAFWDNRSTQHYAVLDYLGQHRRMERVTFAGGTSFLKHSRIPAPWGTLAHFSP